MNDNLLRTQRYFLLTILLIILAGLIMVYSASYIFAKEHFHSSSYFVLRQLVFVLVGVVGAVILAHTKLSFWFKYSIYLQGIIILLLIMTLVPALGIKAKGAGRWINFGFFSLQPAEFVKYSVIFVAVPFFSHFSQWSWQRNFWWVSTLLLPMIILAIQPDFGAFTIYFLVLAFVAFLSNFPRRYFYGFLGTGGALAALVLLARPYRVQRILTYLDPWQNPRTSGFQIIQSYLAFANGSWLGRGLGNSDEKLFYLPEAHNDFIFSVVGEEWGLLGVLAIVALFLGVILLGLKMAVMLENVFGQMVVATITFVIGIQAFLNMAVVLGLLPTKGLNLPFFSYGGSSMMANLLAMGLMFAALGPERGQRTRNES